ncbi:hypothetical protein LTR91_016462 [Friedmanniomyces endolithicus]|uniref:PH domain-containing protein n=1 Tax=Friedmanniomyces endolithicus TaxID=329885 RepID=A0AAN6QKV9_9PEZI|nr:hypothetical protein LTR75_015754 [Friedmanniomyces endolithicus]KAK0785323.1 hypothetical protein LTR38_012405 [Friedmanniomyces endolithicus]KAK0846951.1 hypothetical protein LTR03_006631 [Friedmanniomyces endolithicus]KAK0863790.1 hypothetical protein LTS02_006348 [Friedmanniomyces endolithicus]KAK0876228.1 hypothetical protein LTR87_009988 [Friedmanniomyces endolithicus]
MANVASFSQPRAIPGAGLASISPDNNMPLPNTPIHRLKSANLTLDTMSPVTQNGSFAFDRVIKSGQVLKRTRKTKSWKPVFIVLRPNLLSIYRDKEEAKLRHQINLSDLTAIARQKDPKRKGKHVFGLFSPSRNFHLEATTEEEAQAWVELLRREARMDEDEGEMYLASPGGARSAYQGFGRSIDAIAIAGEDRGGYSSSDADAMGAILPLPRQRDRGNTNVSTFSARRPSQIEYSGPDHGSYSDFSDAAGPAARMSALSLSYGDVRPSTSSSRRPQQQPHSIYGSTPIRQPTETRILTQTATPATTTTSHQQPPPDDPERVLYHGYIHLLKSKSGVRQWKKLWMVLRSRALALYKTEEEYTALLILPFHTIIDVVEIDAISRSRTSCMQVLSEERNYRFCAVDEESLARWLGAFKSLLSRRKGGAGGLGGLG